MHFSCLVTVGLRRQLFFFQASCKVLIHGVSGSLENFGKKEMNMNLSLLTLVFKCSVLKAMPHVFVGLTYISDKKKNVTALIYLCHLPLLQLYNGPNQQAPLIGTFCGSQPPPANITSSSSLTVVFRTDSSVSQSGFQMMWYQNGKRPEQQDPESFGLGKGGNVPV